ncbi:hypothetical protein HDC92_001787 [Pedobacter sp. AK017]|uniref:baeRF3 domain-containing protein n=1 Tax=Pedobacter sp. AK017 TaxID=2723073 RepID=UPI001618E8AE|nr:hypothetical protein [Pedobacter sp. AK017]MBB5438112.1 hypothetical protein [Pedobacter sp. AK017]
MISINKELVKELSLYKDTPCISVYMPAHQSHPRNLQDILDYKKLLKKVEISLSQLYSLNEIKQHMNPLESLINDKKFWNHTTPGIAIFNGPGIFKVIGLLENVGKMAIVANSFHTKPLRQFLQTMDRYQILGLSLDRIQLFEGNRHSLIEIILPEETPTTLTAVLGKEVTEKHTTVASYGGVGKGSIDMHHGDGGIKDQIDHDTEKFFRFVSKEIFENFSKPTGLPLILAALPEHHSLFHEVSKNPFLLKEGIYKNPEHISTDNLAKMAWKVMEPAYLLKIKDLIEQFGQAKANNLGSDELETTAKAVAMGRVATLLVEAHRIISGKITDNNTGSIEYKPIKHPKINDLLDNIANMAITMGSDVLVIPLHDMPSQTGLAAIFRY